MASLGNPAPLGLLAFGTTTNLLMYVEMGWCEVSFEEQIFGVAFFYGGLAQLIVGIMELFKGNSFAFAAFGTYGAYWMAKVVTTGFWICTLHKNPCLVIVFGLLAVTFYLLALASAGVIAASTAGVFGFITGLSAWRAYTAFAELINEEYGGHILPGLKPLCGAPSKGKGGGMTTSSVSA
ncbi:hypothetical protein EMIHUDRAFT_116652 [Emiliania huxleyi CCMP1516]|uniref:Uncharacterized protein n=2 Tax=Emiliania huxleyi TaxID=2903 RepID=A0A0D3JGH2_EMIH1|nr:hypothetical protein EMIHUDRAFT_116652 [Emiliania huxleyi CCMP1516]EOD22607.1 hypothetical protein EMIHUDRAFT_116652 [Emiliania huxleyi CCMP1516]|eukprot:XP_005775036.1 hypothetical protein EMIHUDRAFT_116652 [Emiliania huxleyi CCMP1516]